MATPFIYCSNGLAICIYYIIDMGSRGWGTFGPGSEAIFSLGNGIRRGSVAPPVVSQ